MRSRSIGTNRNCARFGSTVLGGSALSRSLTTPSYGHFLFSTARAISSQSLSESIKRLRAIVGDRYPEVPWREVIAFRDVIVHDYLGLNLDRIWDIATIHVPALKPHINASALSSYTRARSSASTRPRRFSGGHPIRCARRSKVKKLTSPR